MTSIIRRGIKRIQRVFALHLLWAHLKYNSLGLLYWTILFLIINDKLGYAFGLSFLFNAPEVNNEISSFSFFLIGISVGGFAMAFHTRSYRRLSAHYPFLVRLGKPFVVFLINNSIIPIVFLLNYLWRIHKVLAREEFISYGEVRKLQLMLLLGFLTFIILAIAFFLPWGKKISENNSTGSVKVQRKLRMVQRIREKKEAQEAKVEIPFIYFDRFLRIRNSRSVKHFSPAMFTESYARTRISASFFELLTLFSFVVIGLINDKVGIELPAGMSILLLLTLLIMVYNSLRSWFRSWTILIILGVFITIQFLSVHTSMFHFESRMIGLDYRKKVPYSIQNIEKHYAVARENSSSDSLLEISRLNAWKLKTGKKKPLLLIVNTSGGGSRSAYWTFETLNALNSISKGKFVKHLNLISGASGGMLGASFFREISSAKEKRALSQLRKAISSDLLNQLALVASTKDVFYRKKQLRKGFEIVYDRGISFEDHLNQQTFGVFQKEIKDIAEKESKAEIPAILFTPTIVNDGRALLISGMPTRFLLTGPEKGNMYPFIDFKSFFHNTSGTQLSSIIRMNASFPYVLPMMRLPTEEDIVAMDAGVRDNFGGKISCTWLRKMHDWIEKETSGVVVLQIRDSKGIYVDEKVDGFTFLDKLTKPMFNLQSNFPQTHDFEQDALYEQIQTFYKVPVKCISFNLRNTTKDRISLSWHLTRREKQLIQKALYSEENKTKMKSLVRELVYTK